MDAVLFISHGSHSAQTKKEVAQLTRSLAQKSGVPIVEFAFLEIAKPDIPCGIESCVKKGARRIFVLLNFLNSGKHVDVDIPKIIVDAKKRYSNIEFKTSRPIGQHQSIPNLFLDTLSQLKNVKI